LSLFAVVKSNDALPAYAGLGGQSGDNVSRLRVHLLFFWWWSLCSRTNTHIFLERITICQVFETGCHEGDQPEHLVWAKHCQVFDNQQVASRERFENTRRRRRRLCEDGGRNVGAANLT
jgi:hypothetical protein